MHSRAESAALGALTLVVYGALVSALLLVCGWWPFHWAWVVAWPWLAMLPVFAAAGAGRGNRK